MNRFRMLLIAAALMTGGSALASAQSNDHDGRGYEDRDRYCHEDRDRYRHEDRDWNYDRDRHFDRDDRRWSRDRDDYRFHDNDDRRRFDRDDYRYSVGEGRWFSGFYWTWDGHRWCRRDGGVRVYLGF